MNDISFDELFRAFNHQWPRKKTPGRNPKTVNEVFIRNALHEVALVKTGFKLGKSYLELVADPLKGEKVSPLKPYTDDNNDQENPKKGRTNYQIKLAQAQYSLLCVMDSVLTEDWTVIFKDANYETPIDGRFCVGVFCISGELSATLTPMASVRQTLPHLHYGRDQKGMTWKQEQHGELTCTVMPPK